MVTFWTAYPFHIELFIMIKQKLTCKPGSVGSVLVPYLSAINLDLPSPARLRDLAVTRVLPSGSGEQPSDAGIHELATSKAHSTCVTTGLVGSYPTFSPLPCGGCFLLRLSAVADCFPLGSGMLCVARTFLSPVGDSGRPVSFQSTKLHFLPYKMENRAYLPCHFTHPTTG